MALSSGTNPAFKVGERFVHPLGAGIPFVATSDRQDGGGRGANGAADGIPV